MKNFFLLLVGLAFIGGSIYLFLHKQAPVKYQDSNKLTLEDKTLTIEVADTDVERIQGLSGRETLPLGTGMLFVFENPGIHGIWMKDMKFPIDIIWLDKDMSVISKELNVSPDTYPQVFYPSREAYYVLEVKAGTF
ncbi:MAG TPA: DUF192 domain-containing protein [Candidatus Paceibacterota bacterium]